MSYTFQTISDSSEHAIVRCTLANTGSATSAATIFDASALEGHVSSPVLYIESCEWSLNAAPTGGVSIFFDASTDQIGLTLGPGNGAFSSDDFSVIAKPSNTSAGGFTGDIKIVVNKVDGFGGSGSAVSAVNGTVLVKVVKFSGYRE